MSISSAVRAMAEAGATVEQLVRLVEVLEAERHAEDEARRAKAAEKKRRQRAALVPGTKGDKGGQRGTEDNAHTVKPAENKREQQFPLDSAVEVCPRDNGGQKGTEGGIPLPDKEVFPHTPFQEINLLPPLSSKETPPKGGGKKGGFLPTAEPGVDPAPEPVKSPPKQAKPKRVRLNAVEGVGPDEMPDDWLEAALVKHGWTPKQVWWVWDGFWDYFTGKNAKEPLKIDWKATFLTWCRRETPPTDERIANGHQARFH